MKRQKPQKPHTRIVAGKIKGKLVECPPGEVRPMTSKVREALFNIIGNCSGMNMLDMFCGSGSISIEAYSRGMGSSDLVEYDHGKKNVIEKNLKNAGFENANLFISDAFLYCERCSNDYDLIMLDPPFRWDRKEELIRSISEKKLLKKDGTLVIHISKKEKINDELGDMYKSDTRKYGLNVLMFFKNK